ncbi:macrophage mannose receptor 1-like [Xyrichtys novacula]|uniref:Macrophage mannose receptor 1-like n=1 Tax=Xyrichtys novacula TaxID=13765 RepID=A0AAV1FRS2_XYRNO|nr:macrophage mannose receptor 1-like [Xyrichtys novacula]
MDPARVILRHWESQTRPEFTDWVKLLIDNASSELMRARLNDDKEKFNQVWGHFLNHIRGNNLKQRRQTDSPADGQLFMFEDFGTLLFKVSMGSTVIVVLLFTGFSVLFTLQQTQDVFYYINTNTTWDDAADYCEHNYIGLAQVDSSKSVETIIKISSKGYTGKAWIGLYQNNSTWTWENGQPLIYSNWINMGDGFCGSIGGDGYWIDKSCSLKRSHVCMDKDGFYVYDNNLSWNDSKTDCEARGYTLAYIHDEIKNAELQAELGMDDNHWIGLSRSVSWTWTESGTNVTFQNWQTGQPDNPGSNNCVAVQMVDGNWTDEACTTPLPFLCYSEKTTTDSPESSELSHEGAVRETNSTSNSTAQAVRKTMIRMKIATDANMENGTLISGLNQQLQKALAKQGLGELKVTWRKVPVKAQEQQQEDVTSEMDHTIPLLFSIFGLCTPSFYELCRFHYIDLELNWTDAQHYCRDKYSDLATIESQTYISHFNGPKQAWIGLNDDPLSWQTTTSKDRNSWRWSSTGEITGYQNWYKQKPDNYKGGEFCVIFNQHGTWDDKRCDLKFYFSCYTAMNSSSPKIFKMIASVKTWKDAQAYCRTHYTDLAMIENAQENAEVLAQKEEDTMFMWIGLSREAWKWSDNRESSFRNWRPGHPDNDGYQYCVSRGSQHQWNDNNCEKSSPSGAKMSPNR